MKKLPFLFSMLVSCMALFAEPKENLIQFITRAETNVEADYVNVEINVQKKEKNFEKAFEECTKLIEKITQMAVKTGISEDNIYKTKFNIQLNTGFLGKEAAVSSKLYVKIHNQAIFQEIISRIRALDDSIQITNFEYKLENATKDKIRLELITIATQKAEAVKREYEKNLNISLKLFSVMEMQPQGPPGYTTTMSAFKTEQYAQDRVGYPEQDLEQGSKFPVFHITLTLYVRYEIIN